MTRSNRDTTKPPLARTTGRKARAFTMVEVLMVVVILAVLASLISGVTVYVMDKANREQTLVNQQVIMNAVDRYYDIMGEYPPDNNVAGVIKKPALPTDPIKESGFILLHFLAFPGLPQNTDSIDPAAMTTRMQGRVTKIQKASAAILLELPEDTMDAAGFKDAYGNYMVYIEDGGLGGTPVLISPGPDGRGSWQTDGVAADDEDNIRSDNR